MMGNRSAALRRRSSIAMPRTTFWHECAEAEVLPTAKTQTLSADFTAANCRRSACQPRPGFSSIPGESLGFQATSCACRVADASTVSSAGRMLVGGRN